MCDPTGHCKHKCQIDELRCKQGSFGVLAGQPSAVPGLWSKTLPTDYYVMASARFSYARVSCAASITNCDTVAFSYELLIACKSPQSTLQSPVRMAAASRGTSWPRTDETGMSQRRGVQTAFCLLAARKAQIEMYKRLEQSCQSGLAILRPSASFPGFTESHGDGIRVAGPEVVRAPLHQLLILYAMLHLSAQVLALESSVPCSRALCAFLPVKPRGLSCANMLQAHCSSHI